MKARPGAALALVAGVLLLYWPAVSGRGVFFERDIYNYWKPHADWALSSLAAGRTIAWNPALQFGLPFLADPNFQAFYPPTWLLIALPPSVFYAFLVVGHALLAGFGMLRLLRVHGFERGALPAALAFALSGPFVSIANLWHHYCAAAWMPWVLSALHELIQSEGRQWRRCAALSALAALAGSAETIVMTAVIALLIEGPRLLPPRVLRGLVLCLLTGAAVASVQWLPTLAALRGGARDLFTPAQKLSWSLEPERLVAMVMPGRLAGSAAGSEGAESSESTAPLVANVYLGAFLLPLAIAGAFRLPRAAAAFGLFVVGSLGAHLGPIGELIASGLPFRYPSKLLAGVSFLWALLVGAGAHSLGARDNRPWERWGALLGAVSLGVILMRASGLSRDALPLTLPLMLLGSAVILRPPHPSMIALAVFADLFTVEASTHRYGSPDLYRFRPPAATFVGSALPAARIYSPLPNEAALVRDLLIAPGRPASLRALAATEGLVPPHGMSFGLRHGYSPDFTGLATREAAQWTAYRRDHPIPLSRLLSLGAIDFAVAAAGADLPESMTPAAQLPGALPTPVRVVPWGKTLRASVPRRVRFVESGEAAMKALASDAFEPGADVTVVDPSRAGSIEESSGGQATIVRDDNDGVEIRVLATTPAFLVLRDSRRDGWKANVNGEARPIRSADVLFRAVPVPAGESFVTFRYDTPGLRLAWGLAAAGALALLSGLRRWES